MSAHAHKDQRDDCELRENNFAGRFFEVLNKTNSVVSQRTALVPMLPQPPVMMTLGTFGRSETCRCRFTFSLRSTPAAGGCLSPFAPLLSYAAITGKRNRTARSALETWAALPSISTNLGPLPSLDVTFTSAPVSLVYKQQACLGLEIVRTELSCFGIALKNPETK